MKKILRTRRPARLSEGMSRRPLDYSIQYDGKVHALDVLSGTTASPSIRFSVRKSGLPDGQNRIYAGENLCLLRTLMRDPAVKGKVSLVYIDPPFATGAAFESRDAQQSYEDVLTGAEYLEFLRQRLIVIRELLSPKGSIYLHLDGKMAFPAKIIMDEVFGPANFRNWITRKKSNRKNFTSRQYGNYSDYLLFYTKSSDYIWNRPYEKWTDEWAKVEYPYVDAEGRRYKKVPIHAPGVRNGETGKPWREKMPPPGKHWQYTPAKLDEMDARGEIYWSPTGNPRRIMYHDQSNGIAVQDIWMDYRDAHNQNIAVTGYPTEKNIDLLRRIVAASSNEGDLVLDCFMGSGTTLVAAESLGRRWIGVDNSLNAVETTLKRLANGSECMGDFVTGKKPKLSPSLFPSDALTTGFDFYVADGTVPAGLTVGLVDRTATLFSTTPTSTPL